MEKLPVIDKSQLENRLKDGKYVLVFMATWCPDCSFIKPKLPEIESDFSDYKFIQVDRDENIYLAQEMNVYGIPSFVVYSDGTEIGRLANKDRKSKSDVETFLSDIAD